VLKVWSKKKGLNNNKMGYLGGIVIAIMAAKVCQLFPNYSLCQLIQEFFDCYSRWDWERIPLKITDDKELC
jgi:poly(A) polymerase